MESVTGKPPFRSALAGGSSRDDWLGLGAGLVVLAALVAANVAFDLSAVLLGSFVVAPFVCALLARATVTMLVGAIAVAVVVGSQEWNMDFGTAEWIAAGMVAIGTVFATASAWNRQRSRFRGERLRILDTIATFADGSRPLDETLDRVTEQIVPRIADICMIDVIHPSGVTRAAVRAAGHPRAREIEDGMRRRPPSLPRWLLTGERHWRHIPRWRPRMGEEEVRRMATSEEDLEFLISLRLRSSLVVPISSREHDLGALTLLSAWSRRRYTEDDVRFAQIAARRIGLALDNAGLFSDLESVERRMNTVMSILDEAVMIQARDGELVFANPAAARALGFARPEELVEAPREQIAERLSLRDESGRPVGPEALVAFAGQDREPPPPRTVRATLRESGVESWYRARSRPIEGPDGTPLYVVTVVEDVTDVKRAEFAQGLLARTGELLASSADYRRTLDEVAQLAVPDFADWCTVAIPAPGGGIEEVGFAHLDPARARLVEELRERFASRIDGSRRLAEVIRTGRAERLEIDDAALRAEATGEEHLRTLRELRIGSALVVPMVAGGSVVGAIGFVNDSASREFDDADLEVAVELGRRAGLAAENARIAGERALVSEALQRELLPPALPEMDGWEVATMYRPAGEVSEVGGDFYEAFALGDRWAVVLGDVSGHGAPAASLTALARHTIRTATTLSADPATGLRALDDRLRERDAVALCSIAILLLPRPRADESQGVSIWLAGHPPPFLLRDGAPTEVGAAGPLVGIGEDPAWDAETVSIEAGDELIVYTDGVTEARRPDGERFGVDRLRQRLSPSDEPSTTVARVESALAGFASGEPEDDATVVAIRRTPVSGDAPGGAEPAARSARGGSGS